MAKPRVAITQPYIILGGRLEVILGIVKALNGLGIEPDILCLSTAFHPDQVEQKYGYQLKMKYRMLYPRFNWRRIPANYQIVLFNSFLNKICRDYDLIIDSGNSQLFLPTEMNVLSYVHFPIEGRIFASVPNINLPNQKIPFLSERNFTRHLMRLIYRTAKPKPTRQVVCNSIFTRESTKTVYPTLPDDTPVIYPPVRLDEYYAKPGLREKSIVALGRFTPEKGQLEEIKVAERLPEITFHIMGFVQKPNYFNLCQQYADDRRLRNVQLHPNIAYDDMITLIRSAKYFLHSQINEPFGISAVQGLTAGCLPIVHNSGGQKETVPNDELRYSSMDEIPDIIRRAEQKCSDETNSMVEALQKNAREKFDEPVFHDIITRLLKQNLNLE